MTDLSHAFRAHWTERRPAPLEMTDSERYQWLKENCNEVKYFEPTPYSAGHFLIVDRDGRRTVEKNFNDAVDVAAAKLKESNT
jgi:hypothetical protein